MTTDAEIKLLPCPCCGRQDLDHHDMLHSDGAMRVRCVWCNCEAPEDAWNRRVSLEAGQPAASAEPVDLFDTLFQAAVSHLDGNGITIEGQDVVSLIEVLVTAVQDASPVAQEPTESVLIDDLAYTVPAPVAAELLRLHIELRQGVPVAQEPADSALPYEQALSELIDKIVPDLDTGDILADARQASAALDGRPSVVQEPVGYLACDPETGKPEWGEDCICADNVYSPGETGTIGRPVVFAASVAQVQPVVNLQLATEPKNIRTGDPYDDPIFERLCREHDIWGTPQSALCAVFWRAGRASAQDREDAEKYRRLHTPEIVDFVAAVENEALYQRERWGASDDAGKSDADWFWLVGYLAGKAIRPDATNKKRLHHIITTAAACLNWHAARVGTYVDMRSGIAEPDDRAAKETDHA